jgi:uncharacterized delta-60 repeat protein
MYVKKIAIQHDGKIIIGGRFRATSGYYYPYFFYINLVRLNIDGAIDLSFFRGDPRLHDGDINSISLQSDGKIIISGNFTKHYDSQISRNRITRLNVNGTPDGTFNVGTGANATINNSAIQSDGKIIIGGEFTSFNDFDKNYLTRLNADGSIDNTFNIGTGPNGFINSISVQNDSKIIVTGDFTIFNNTSANRIVRLNSDGTIDATFNYGEGFNNIIYSTSIQNDGKIIIGGKFTSYNGSSRNRIARINGDKNLGASNVDKNSMNIYPNPVNNLLQIQIPNDIVITSYKISDILGKVIIEQKTNSNLINTETLSKGLYIIEVISGKDKFTSKFIKE